MRQCNSAVDVGSTLTPLHVDTFVHIFINQWSVDSFSRYRFINRFFSTCATPAHVDPRRDLPQRFINRFFSTCATPAHVDPRRDLPQRFINRFSSLALPQHMSIRGETSAKGPSIRGETSVKGP